MDKIKHLGQVFTPKFIVEKMLNLYGKSLLGKRIFEPSVGEGAFLCEIVRRYIGEFLAVNSDKEALKNELQTYIFGVEIDKNLCEKTTQNLDKIAARFGIYGVKWNLYNADTLNIYKNLPQMDLIIGNPPYVRIHNVAQHNLKDFHFTKSGMADLYLAFFEIGFRLLGDNGVLIFITPSSWFSSKCAKNMREFVCQNTLLTHLLDLGHTKIFENITTYSAISQFQKRENSEVCVLSDDLGVKNRLKYSEIFDKKDYKITLGGRNTSQRTHIVAKNGFATLCDGFFIGENDFKLTIPIYKASTGKFSRCIFPYDKHLKLLDLEHIKRIDARLYEYFMENMERLKSRDLRGAEWWAFGRTQGLNDTFKPKIAFNTLIKDISSIKIAKINAGVGVYSGLYIAGDYDFSEIESVIKTADFVDFVKSLRKYKNGGYYTFSSGDLSAYLSEKLPDKENLWG